MTRAFVIARQRKGGKVRTVVDEVRHALQAASWKVDWVIVKRKRDLTRKTARAVKKGCDVVVIVGGDGAVLQVAPSLARTKVALGIIPTGTGNQLAGNLHIPPDRRRRGPHDRERATSADRPGARLHRRGEDTTSRWRAGSDSMPTS